MTYLLREESQDKHLVEVFTHVIQLEEQIPHILSPLSNEPSWQGHKLPALPDLLVDNILSRNYK